MFNWISFFIRFFWNNWLKMKKRLFSFLTNGHRAIENAECTINLEYSAISKEDKKMIAKKWIDKFENNKIYQMRKLEMKKELNDKKERKDNDEKRADEILRDWLR